MKVLLNAVNFNKIMSCFCYMRKRKGGFFFFWKKEKEDFF